LSTKTSSTTKLLTKMFVPFDIVVLIDSFLCLKSTKYNLKFLSKKFSSVTNCKVLQYKDLTACKYHDDENLYECISILKKNIKKTCRSIHFKNLESMNHAKKHLTDFGKINHFCCGGIGVVYDS
jgi:hypothetical protein